MGKTVSMWREVGGEELHVPIEIRAEGIGKHQQVVYSAELSVRLENLF